MRDEIQEIVNDFFSEKKRNLSRLFHNDKMTLYTTEQDLEIEGLYAFWFKSSHLYKMKNTFSFDLELKGARGECHPCMWNWHFDDEWTLLYVGKTGNFKNRLGMHLMLNTTSDEWGVKKKKWKIEKAIKENILYKPTTSCQLRSGIEHLLHNKTDPTGFEIKEFLKEHLWVSYMAVKDVSNRFYAEDLAIGQGCPWFNLDSER